MFSTAAFLYMCRYGLFYLIFDLFGRIVEAELYPLVNDAEISIDKKCTEISGLFIDFRIFRYGKFQRFH